MGEECVFDRLDYCIVHKTDRTTCQTKEWYRRENAALRSSVEKLQEALVEAKAKGAFHEHCYQTHLDGCDGPREYPEDWATDQTREEFLDAAALAQTDGQDSGGGGGGEGRDEASRKNVSEASASNRHPAPANPAAPPEKERCDRCGWPLEDDPRKGCIKGNCSQRPMPPKREPWVACPSCSGTGQAKKVG